MRLDQYNETWLRRQTPRGLAFKVIAFGLVVALLLCGAGWIFGWFKTAADVVSPDNVKKQWEFAYSYDEALGAIATNWCNLKQAEDAATGDTKDQRVSQRLAASQLYATRQAEYDAALENAFKARLIRPPDVPDRAPSLAEKVRELHLTDCTP